VGIADNMNFLQTQKGLHCSGRSVKLCPTK
jgi:hypothetical protein